MARKPDETINLRVRMPEALRTTIAVEAAKAGRSLNAEILYRLGLTLGKKWSVFIGEIEREERDEKERRDRFLNDPVAREKVSQLIAEYFEKHPEDNPGKKGR